MGGESGLATLVLEQGLWRDWILCSRSKRLQIRGVLFRKRAVALQERRGVLRVVTGLEEKPSGADMIEGKSLTAPHSLHSARQRGPLLSKNLESTTWKPG